jgi:hypothetical protein
MLYGNVIVTPDLKNLRDEATRSALESAQTLRRENPLDELLIKVGHHDSCIAQNPSCWTNPYLQSVSAPHPFPTASMVLFFCSQGFMETVVDTSLSSGSRALLQLAGMRWGWLR